MFKATFLEEDGETYTMTFSTHFGLKKWKEAWPTDELLTWWIEKEENKLWT